MSLPLHFPSSSLWIPPSITSLQQLGDVLGSEKKRVKEDEGDDPYVRESAYCSPDFHPMKHQRGGEEKEEGKEGAAGMPCVIRKEESTLDRTWDEGAAYSFSTSMMEKKAVRENKEEKYSTVTVSKTCLSPTSSCPVQSVQFFTLNPSVRHCILTEMGKMKEEDKVGGGVVGSEESRGVFVSDDDDNDDGAFGSYSKRARLEEKINNHNHFSTTTTSSFSPSRGLTMGNNDTAEVAFHPSASSLSFWAPPTSAELISVPTDFCTAGGRRIYVKQWRGVIEESAPSLTLKGVKKALNFVPKKSKKDIFPSSSGQEKAGGGEDHECVSPLSSSTLQPELENGCERRMEEGTQEWTQENELEWLGHLKRLSYCATAADTSLGFRGVSKVLEEGRRSEE